MAGDSSCIPNIDDAKLIRDGTRQDERYPKALDPAKLPVLGREPADSILFAKRYAAFLKYFDASDQEDGDWSGFFGRDVSVLLASAATQDVGQYRNVMRACQSFLRDVDDSSDETDVRYNISFLFGICAKTAERIDHIHELLPEDHALKATLANLIRTRLAAPLRRLISYANADASLGTADQLLQGTLAGDALEHELLVFGEAVVPIQAVIDGGLGEDWIGDAGSWEEYLGTITADSSVFGSLTDSVASRAQSCAMHALFIGVLGQFLKVVSRAVDEAAAAFEASITSYDQHAPHYALFIAFLRLFEYARSELNELTQSHLDFYYRDVLRLQERGVNPSAAHLLVELSKNTAAYELAAETAFKGGKDTSHKPIEFRSEEALVANRAAVESLARLYRDGQSIFVDQSLPNGEEAWHPFINDVAIPELGFAVASHYLHLAEGKRTLECDVVMSGYGAGAQEDIAERLILRLTTADGWLEMTPASAEISSTGTLSLTLELDGDQAPIVAFDASVHERGYEVALPIMEVLLVPTEGMEGLCIALEDAKLSSVKLTVTVVGFRSLSVSTDLGPADLSKPFDAFGPVPVVGSALRIGCQEAFIKHGVTTVKLKTQWLNRGDVSDDSKMSIERLIEGAWSEVKSDADCFTPEGENTEVKTWVTDFNAEDDPFAKHIVPFSIDATTGYFKFVLGTVFTDSDDIAISPKLESLLLDYTATQEFSCKSNFEDRCGRFYHIHAFGVAEQHSDLKVGLEDENLYVLPQMRHLGDADPQTGLRPSLHHAAEFYVGLKDLAPPQTVNLLFQVDESSANPQSRKPEDHLHWSYLRDEEWIAFDGSAIQDGTGELIESGIVSLSVPEDATSSNRLMPDELVWIRVAVTELPDAVCSFWGVHAQALKVVFIDQGNDLTFLGSPLPAGTIGKLQSAVSQVKAISQPYESFDGRSAESADSFYTRVSERLRHKERSITLWDFERLILENFPTIHRVRCVNHTRCETIDGTEIYQELAPGHVTIVAVPEASSGKDDNAIKQFVNLSTLDEVSAFLEERSSCFAKLHVKNPEYEELRVECNVKLRDGYDESYYLAKLQTAIVRFLAPWAFDADAHPSFGGKVYASSIIDLLEDQESVDYVTDFALYHDTSAGSGTQSKSEVVASRVDSILAPAPIESHVLTAIAGSEEENALKACGCPE